MSVSYTAVDLQPLLHDAEDGQKKLCPVSHCGSLKKKKFLVPYVCVEKTAGKKCRCPDLKDVLFKCNQNVCFAESEVLGGRMNQNIDGPRLRPRHQASSSTPTDFLPSQRAPACVVVCLWQLVKWKLRS